MIKAIFFKDSLYTGYLGGSVPPDVQASS